MKLNALLAATLSSACLVAAQAQATTVYFSFNLGSTPEATGDFSYATGDTGMLGYKDLASFKVTLEGATYDLAQANSFPQYNYFAYDTAAGAFVGDTNVCGESGCGFKEILGALDGPTGGILNDGFYFTPPDFFNGLGEFADYAQSKPTGLYDSITYRATAGVPEPSSWVLMMLGVGGLGAAIRRARRRRGISFVRTLAA